MLILAWVKENIVHFICPVIFGPWQVTRLWVTRNAEAPSRELDCPRVHPAAAQHLLPRPCPAGPIPEGHHHGHGRVALGTALHPEQGLPEETGARCCSSLP